MEHDLKTWMPYFEEVKSGRKQFELRKNDRGYKIGDTLLLREYNLLGVNNVTQEIEGEYTGRRIDVKVTYILNYEPMKNNFGLEKGYCIMGIQLI